MSEDLVPVNLQQLVDEPPSGGPGARQRLLWLMTNMAQAPQIPLPLKALLAIGPGMMQVGVRSDEDALAVNQVIRVLAQLACDYVDGLPVDVESGYRLIEEAGRRFQGR